MIAETFLGLDGRALIRVFVLAMLLAMGIAAIADEHVFLGTVCIYAYVWLDEVWVA